MRIELIHSEIEEALVAFVASQGIDISDKKIEVDMTAGRGANGYTAQISLVKDESVPTLAEVPETVENNSEAEPEDASKLFANG